MPIKLSYDDSPLTNGGDVTICGWGSMSASGTSASAYLMAATVDYLPNSCGKYKKPDTNEYVSSLMVCAGCPNGKVDTCQGDSGGPLTVVSASKGCPILVGFTSFGEGCADPNYPGVYTRASSQVAWLEKQAGRVFHSQYALAPTSECDTCAGWNKGKCGLAPAFDGSACQTEGYLASAFQLRLKTCSKANRLAAGASLPVEALFNPASFGSFKPGGYVYFLRAQSEGSSSIQLEGVTVTVPFKGPVESRNGTSFQNYWRLFWLPDADAPNRTCSDYFAYAAAFISSDKKFIQVTSPVRPTPRP
ncbi:hypothetical protein CBR_g36645 [Chara braunii]|uniref:Peptidase S1 domain-containing protein n=1 Tax=Chara braunii TaxID=69332 RepID=A0A388LL14_CHABU|nr:hypothetical protein CBR_g36645 [Chara braunii]|eukprot:GBG83026.1 hypothetical protein CBR_g36645 [Chara braunii]